MPVFEVIPHVGIGPLRLGMTQAEVRHAIAGSAVRGLRGCLEVVRDLGLWVDYTEGFTAVKFVQASEVAGVRVLLAGADVFDTPADELVARLVQQEGLNVADFPPGRHSYLYEALRLVLWRERVPEAESRPFDCVSVHAEGCYSETALRLLREGK